MSLADIAKIIDVTFDGNGSGSAIPSAEPLSSAVTPSVNDVDGSNW
jgi:NifU-like protein involved in Fe-S cluster formation